MKRIWVYDEENLFDFHCSVFIDRHSDETRIFEISNFKNELKELKEFWIKEVLGVWGYNNNFYDDVITQKILKSYKLTANELYTYSQHVIASDRIYTRLPVPSSDVFRMLHFDRFKVSLKWCEAQMYSESIEEMPLHYTESINERTTADKVINYCIYDAQQTKKVITSHPEALDIRRSVAINYPQIQNPFSLSNTGIGKATMLHDYCQITGDDPYEVKTRRTKHDVIYIKDVISDKIQFKTKALQNFLTYLKNKKSNLAKEELSEYIYFQNMHYDLKKGGLHGVQGTRSTRGKKAKVDCRLKYESNDVDSLIDFDWGSYYPYLLSVLDVAPAHLDKAVFLKLIETYTLDRIAAKKAKDKVKAHDLKIKINSLYGLLGDKDSFLFDLKAMYTVTINGQLLLLMLIEEMSILGIQCWYANTDGSSYIVPKIQLDQFNKVCESFKEIIDIPQEIVEFNKAYIKDVNNFIILKSDGTLKLKGCYEYNSFLEPEGLPLNKNNSNLASAKAAVFYLTQNKSIMDSLINEQSILPFTITKRTQKTAKRGLPKIMWFENADRDQAVELQKTTRYIVSVKGGVLKLVYNDGYETHCEAHPTKDQFFYTTILNKLTELDKNIYDIDYLYYQREARKLCRFKLNNLQASRNQLQLF